MKKLNENISDILKARILIVDNMKSDVILLEQTLHRAGYTSITSTMNPNKVCDLYRTNRYDLILLDINMPGMDGFQVMECLNEIEEDDNPSVLVITAEPGHKLRALQAGAKDFISKPFELIEVLTRVHNMVEARLQQKEIAEHKDDNPAISSVIQRNIRKIIKIRKKATSGQSIQNRIAHVLTTFSGSMTFFYLHIVWFCVWIVLNTGRVGVQPFDPYPYGFLSIILAMEVIILATFVLISQNALGKEAERLTDLGLHTGLLTEHELTRALQMLRSIQHKIGIINDENCNLSDEDLEMETKPEDVLAEIERLHRRSAEKTAKR